MSTQRRILHIATRYLRAGSERNLLHSMEWEQDHGFDVELATSSASATHEVEGRFRIHRIDALRREIHPYQDLVAVRQLRRLIGDERYDIVHTHQSKAGILGRVAARGLARRIVHTVHMASFGAGYNPIASGAFRWAEKRAAGFTDVTVFVGEELRRLYLDAGVSRNQSSIVIRSPIDVSRFAGTRDWTAPHRHEARRAYGLPTDGSLILWIGALTRRKRPILAVRVLRDVLADGACLAIAGAGPERPGIEAAASALGLSHRVHLLGHLDDIGPFLGAGDVVVHTSTLEGVPQVVLQALAAGRPVVATDAVGLREVTGAPIRVVERSGAGVAAAVRRCLAEQVDAVPLSALEPWTSGVVDRQIDALHERLS